MVAVEIPKTARATSAGDAVPALAMRMAAIELRESDALGDIVGDLEGR
ncbi:hypothetical protein AB0H49_09340 [Nocardia sp. NPDC050713]